MNNQEAVVPKYLHTGEWNGCDPDTDASGNNWQFWCRLCAKEDAQNNISVFFTKDQPTGGNGVNGDDLSLEAAIKKYFWVNIIREEELPKVVCTDCYTLVTTLVNFSERVSKVQKLFCSLQNSHATGDLHLQSLRIQYGLNDGESEHRAMQQGVPELQFFEIKPQINELNQKILEDRSIEEDPLEHESIEIKCEKENSLDAVNGEVENVGIEVEDFVPKDINKDGKRLRILRNCTKRQSKQTTQAKKNQHSVGNKNKRTVTGGNDKIYACSECPGRFKRLLHFRYHMIRTHPDMLKDNSKETEFRCGECSRVFLTQYNLERHAKAHLPLPLIACSYCDKTFTSNCYIQKHIDIVHTNKREFVCEKCGVAVKTIRNLKDHMLTHTDYAPFECDICQKRFKNKVNLKKHVEVHDPRKHICSECGLELNSRTTLNRHLLVHSDEMLHKCDYCGRAFKRAKTLKTHLILHTGLKPYSCDFCDRTFANGSNCRSHKKKVHPEELAALEAAGGGKTYTRNIPKLETLKAVTKTGDNLATVVSKPSGCFSLGRKPKIKLNETNETTTSKHSEQTLIINTTMRV